MKKSLFPRLALMAVVVALVSACSEKKFEYTNVIPAKCLYGSQYQHEIIG